MRTTTEISIKNSTYYYYNDVIDLDELKKD